MSNPLELAIFALKRELGKAAIDDPCQICYYVAAIRVLEAAGKVDKHSAICSMRHSDANESWSGLDEDWVTINALLAALPEVTK